MPGERRTCAKLQDLLKEQSGSRRSEGTIGHAGQDNREEIWTQAELFTSEVCRLMQTQSFVWVPFESV